jgi:hypothetical protein
MFSAERHISRVSTRFCDQSRAWHRIVPHIVLVSFRAGQHRQRQVHIHTRFTFTRFTFTHASHSHTLHITHASHHTRFPFTHASHSHTHTRDSLFDSCRILCLSVSVLGNTGSVKFTFTHAHTRLAKGNTGSVRFTFTHTHTRLAKGNTGSVRFTFTHASHSRIENTHTLVKGLRRCIIYLL